MRIPFDSPPKGTKKNHNLRNIAVSFIVIILNNNQTSIWYVEKYNIILI